MSNSRQTVDLLIDAQWVVPVRPSKVSLKNHSVAVVANRIVAIMPTTDAHKTFVADKHIVLGNHVLIPGLINLHTHAAMSLMRGQADDSPLMRWLSDHIWPTETRHISEQFVYDGTLLACAEMLRAGITFANDMYFFPGAAIRAFIKSGMRAAIGIIVIYLPTAYASDAQNYLDKGLAIRDEYKHETKLSFCLAPDAPYTVNDKSLTQILTYAEQLNIPIHIHLHETLDELRQSQTQYSMRPIERLQKLGMIGPGLLAVHCVHMEKHEIALFARQGCHVVHCPSSNMKLASGIAPIAELLANGVNVGLGTDGAASNNRLDIFSEMRLAALLGKVATGQASALPAHQVLEMATINSAKALGLEDQIGSISVGKYADLVAVDFSAIELLPCYDPISHLVYVAGRENVSHVWVDGKLLVDQGKLNTIDRQEIQGIANYWQNRISPS